MTWREKVIQLMGQRGINQKQLAELSGITESSVSRYLHSEKKPRMDILINFAKALQVETNYLLDTEERSESAYTFIATAIARKGSELNTEEKNRLIALILGKDLDV